MPKKPAGVPKLSNLERDIMRAVWALGECTSNEVIDEFTKQRPLAKTTIRTVLATLHKKGYVERLPSVERGHRIRAAVSRECVARRSLKDLVSGLFADSPAQAISFLLKDEDIDDAELEEIRKLLNARKRRRSTSTDKKGRKP